MSADIGVPNGIDVRRTDNNESRASPPSQALTGWSAGTKIVNLVGNDNRAVGWKLELDFAASHVALPHTQAVELSKHPIIREALRDRGGRDPVLADGSIVAIPIDLAAVVTYEPATSPCYKHRRAISIGPM